MESNKDMVVSDQGADIYQKGHYIAFFFMNCINALMIILVKDREKLVCGCVIPRFVYGPKKGNPLEFL